MPIGVKPIGEAADGVYILDLSATQGDDLALQFDFTDDGIPHDFTGYSALAQVRDAHHDLITEFSSDASPATAQINEGSIALLHTSAEMTAIAAGQYRYDFQVSDPPSLIFAGRNGWVNVGDISELNSAAAFTIAMWLRQDVVGGSWVFIKNDLLLFTSYTDFFRAQIADGAYGQLTAFSTYAPIGAWTHVAVVYDGAGVANADKL